MEENILPNGWLGIWRSGGVFGSAPIGESTASVLVEIENVIISADAEKLDAVATVSLPGKEDASVGNDRHFRAVVVNHPGDFDWFAVFDLPALWISTSLSSCLHF